MIENEHFAEEREWRVVTVPMKSDDPSYRAIVSDANLRHEGGIRAYRVLEVGDTVRG